MSCHFCGKPCTDGDLCSGCGHYVCPDCDHEAPLGDHLVIDHQDDDLSGFHDVDPEDIDDDDSY